MLESKVSKSWLTYFAYFNLLMLGFRITNSKYQYNDDDNNTMIIMIIITIINNNIKMIIWYSDIYFKILCIFLMVYWDIIKERWFKK